VPLEEEITKTRSNDKIEKRDAVKFKNGVIYAGEWRGNLR